MFRFDRRRSFLQALARHNPFYLLSAASMLLACLLLSNTTTWSPIALHKLLALTVTLSFYELLLVGLALYLIAVRGLVRDGVMLLVLEAFFLADVGFLSSEVYQESLSAGLVVNGLLLLIAIVKLYAIFRVVRLPLNTPLFAICVLTVAVLLMHPALLKQLSDHRHGYVPPLTMYTMWWVLAALIGGYGVLMRFSDREIFRGTRIGVERAGIGHVFMLILLASLIAHIGTAHWVYKSPFEAAQLSPLFLGLAVWFVSLPETNVWPRSSAHAMGVMLVVTALFTAASASRMLTFGFAFATITPVKLALFGGYLTLVYTFVVDQFLTYIVVGIGGTIAYVFAPSWSTMQDQATRTYQWIGNLLSRLLPRSQAGWGAIALVGAFVMLGIGASLSLFHHHEDDDDDGDAEEDEAVTTEAPLPPPLPM